MIYTTGTIAGNGSTITGTGTNFTAAGSLIRVGCTLIAFTNPVQVLQITAITSGTALSVTPAISPAIAAGTKYAILLSDSLSVDGLAQDIAETFGMYQAYMSGFADVMNGTGNVTFTINGQQVTVPGQKSLAKKGANNDITSLSGLTTPLSVEQGGTGAGTPSQALQKLGALPLTGGQMTGVLDMAGIPGNPYAKTTEGLASVGSVWTETVMINGTPRFRSGVTGIGGSISYQIGGRSNASDAFSTLLDVRPGQIVYTSQNTTKASDGTLKAASPIIKLFSDGRAKTNDESEGCCVTRRGVGEYLIEGCMGLNADAVWGGIDGGFDIPTDRNKQPLIWLDYEVNPDGSVLVKTYHRTYPDAPVFARNEREGFAGGDPIDIPADQFVSVRVEMPHDSIYNQAQETAQKAQEEAERLALEEATRKVTEEAQADPDQPHI